MENEDGMQDQITENASGQQDHNTEGAGAQNQPSTNGTWSKQLTKALWESKPAKFATVSELAYDYLRLDRENEELKEAASKAGTSTPTAYKDEDYAEVAKMFRAEGEFGKRAQERMDLMKKKGLSPDEIKFLFTLNDAEKGMQIEVARQLNDLNLKNIWGDKHDENIAYRDRALREMYKDESAMQRIKASGALYNPDFNDLLAKMGRMNSDGVIANPGYGSGGEKPTPVTAKSFGFAMPGERKAAQQGK